MIDKTSTPAQVYASPFMIKVGVVMLVVVGLYFVFMAVNNLGLVDRHGIATVISKEYHDAGTTYTTQKIGNRMQTLPQTTPEMFILKLDVNGKITECAVDRRLYNSIDRGEQVKVVYKKKRILGGLQVFDVAR
jgi:hypothetical protein